MNFIKKILLESTLNEVGDLKDFSYSFRGLIKYKEDSFEYLYKIPKTLKFVDVKFIHYMVKS